MEDTYLQEQANYYGYVLGGCDLWGLSSADTLTFGKVTFFDISSFGTIPDRLTQGTVNFLLLMRLMKGALAKDSRLMFNGRPAIDPSKANYYGNSLGGIMGEVYMAATTDVSRGVDVCVCVCVCVCVRACVRACVCVCLQAYIHTKHIHTHYMNVCCLCYVSYVFK